MNQRKVTDQGNDHDFMHESYFLAGILSYSYIRAIDLFPSTVLILSTLLYNK